MGSPWGRSDLNKNNADVPASLTNSSGPKAAKGIIAMANEPSRTDRRTWLGCNVVATADRLVIRPPIGVYGAPRFFCCYRCSSWIAVEVGLLDRRPDPDLGAVGGGHTILSSLLGRWWTLDRKADSVRYFPLAALCG